MKARSDFRSLSLAPRSSAIRTLLGVFLICSSTAKLPGSVGSPRFTLSLMVTIG